MEKIWQALILADEPEVFSRQEAVRQFLRDTGTVLPSCSRTRNIMRRCENDIHLDRHVVKDGRHVNANVYRPIQPGRYPVIMCMGAFGSAFINGFRTERNAELLEEVEDRFYSEPNRFETQRMAKGIFIQRMLTCVMGSLSLPDKKGKAPKPIQPKQVAAIGKIADKLVVGRLLQGKSPLLPVDFPKMIPVSSAFEQPTPDEVVECPVGTFPSAFRVPKGARLQLHIAPVDPVFVAYDSHTYRPGAVNKVYYGKSHPSYLQIPVLPDNH